MAIDRELPPTNELLLKCGPEGYEAVEEWSNGVLTVEVRNSPDRSAMRDWWLELQDFVDGSRSIRLCYLHGQNNQLVGADASLPLGHVSTIGEVIDLYELLSQKKWPT